MTRETPEAARAMAQALLAYADKAERFPMSDAASRLLLKVCDAAEAFTDDGEFIRLRDVVESELEPDDPPELTRAQRNSMGNAIALEWEARDWPL